MKIEDIKKLMGNTPIREMKYTTKNTRELLCNGIYKEYHFYVLNLGNHPTAYVEIPKKSIFFKKHYFDIDILVHGGLTFSDDELRTSENTKMTNSWFIGWDYAHAGDYCAYMEDMKKMGLNSINSSDDKKWTTQEIIEECISVINQLIENELLIRTKQMLEGEENEKN